MSAIVVEYIYSACVVISVPNQRILCDPWFSEGIYDGSWYHFPRVVDPLLRIGNADSLYISHIHPDHYDPDFIREYFLRYGKKTIYIADHNPNHLLRKMNQDGFFPVVVGENERVFFGEASIEIIPAKTGSISDIDSALIVKLKDCDSEHCVINANDIVFDDRILGSVKARIKEVDILLCGYTGAGPYPQTYYDVSDPELIESGNQKKKEFFDRYISLVTGIGARVNIPFAGKYILGGRLAALNPYRGVADPVEVLQIDKKAVVLADTNGVIDTDSLIPEAVRDEPYNLSEINNRINEISDLKMKYEELMPLDQIHQIPFKRLMSSAYLNSISKSEVGRDYYFVFDFCEELAVVNANKNVCNGFSVIPRSAVLPVPRSEINIDKRYLFGLLVGIYHWNNAEIGSQYSVRRVPNEFDRKAQRFLNYFVSI